MKKLAIPVGVVIVLFLAHPSLFGKEIAAMVASPSARKDLLEVKVSRLVVDIPQGKLHNGDVESMSRSK